MKSNKGYTLVEILAVVIILGILSLIGVISYTRYISSSKKQAYNTLAKSAYQAAEEYYMNDNLIDEVTLNELVELQYLENATDPSGGVCTGKVSITVNNSSNGLDSNDYEVILCCANYNYTYLFPTGTKTKNDECPL